MDSAPVRLHSDRVGVSATITTWCATFVNTATCLVSFAIIVRCAQSLEECVICVNCVAHVSDVQ
jgi:hypothetical protein